MTSSLFRATFLTLLALGWSQDCEDTACLVFVIDGKVSPLTAAQCTIQAPSIGLFINSLIGGPFTKAFCGSYLDEVSGIVVTNVLGEYQVFAAPVVEECASAVSTADTSDASINEIAALADCLTACPYLAAAPVAKVDSASYSPQVTVESQRNLIPKKFLVKGSKFNGYSVSLPNNFGAMHGSVDTVAAKLPLFLKMTITDSATVCNAGSLKVNFDVLQAASPSLTAAAMLFPEQAFDHAGLGRFTNGADVLMRILAKTAWYDTSMKTGAKLVFFGQPPTHLSLAALKGAMEGLKKTDFAGLGETYSTGSLPGRFLYGVLTQMQSRQNGQLRLVNTATFNFPVHAFQEAFAYVFFSPAMLGANSLTGDVKFYAFALNMLVRRMAFIKDLCKVHVGAVHASCDVKAAIYPPELGGYQRSFAGLKAAKQIYDSSVPTQYGGFGKFVSNKPKFFAPPLERLKTDELVILQRDVAADSTAVASLGVYVPGGSGGDTARRNDGGYATDPSAQIANDCVRKYAEDFKEEDEELEAELQNAWSMCEEEVRQGENNGPVCRNFMILQQQHEEHQKDVLGSDPALECMLTGGVHVGDESGLSGGRRLLDVALPGLRSKPTSASASAPAQTREDGTLTRRNVDARRLGHRRLNSYSDINADFVDCIKHLNPDGPSSAKSCVSGMNDVDLLLGVGQSFFNRDEKVVAFYSRTAFVTKACSGGKFFASECPVDIFSKEVSFAFGDSSAGRPDHGVVKTSSYVEKGLPAASRLDRMMNGALELFAAV